MEIPLLDAIDIEILMHRDAHFSGNFDVMIEYYENDGVGAMPDFEIERIYELKNLEKEMQEDLSPKVLPEPAQEQVLSSKKLYKKLREVYTSSKPNPISVFISDLILTEKQVPKKEMQELIANDKESFAPLCHIIDSADFYDPLFPGYGRTPMFAAKCLEKIENPKAIPHLFNALGRENFSLDESIIHALVSFGSSSKDFLLKRLQSKPFSKDNEHAAIVLSSFPPDEEIALIALKLLAEEKTLSLENFSSYLICCCEGLKKESHRQAFIHLADQKGLSKPLQSEIKMIARTFV